MIMVSLWLLGVRCIYCVGTGEVCSTLAFGSSE